MLVVPGLVAGVGLALTVLGQTALHDTSRDLGRDRFREQTGFVARSVAAALANAEPMLDRVRDVALSRAPEDALAPLAHSLRGLMQGRAGIAYTSISYPDGTFQGSYVDTDGVIRFQESRVGKDGTHVRRFDYEDVARLVLRKEEESSYDPRTREFYRLAVDAKHRVWTPPYAFFGSHYTGVTRTEPVFANGRLVAVITADFDVNELSTSIERAPVSEAKTLLYTQDGTVLAFPERAEAIHAIPLDGDRVLSYHDLDDPVITAFFDSVVGQGPIAGEFNAFTALGQTELAMVANVPEFPELGWSAAAIVPESVFFDAERVHARKSLFTAAIALVASLGIAFVFARHVVKVRRDAARAEDLAREATARVRELGSYRLVERLGEGGMGEVWRAEHRLLVRQAAIKLIRRGGAPSSRSSPTEMRERFRREAQTLATLRSRHTIELFDYGVTEDGTFFFVMELLDGVDFETLVSRFGPQPAGRVIHLLIQACSSLAEAHAAGLVHRDIKPANLFICRAADEVDVVKVLDFGLVQSDALSRVRIEPRQADTDGAVDDGGDAIRLTQAGQFMGTPAFMAPEQALGKETDGRSDLYALACVAVWLLTGKLLYEAPTGMALVLAHVGEALPDLGARTPGYYPPELDRLLRQCLAKTREQRPKDALALAAALRAIALPAEEEWTDARALAWWKEHLSTPRSPAAETG